MTEVVETALPKVRGAALCADGVGIRFDSFQAVQNISLDIAAGEFLCLLGPSGCGKSTLLSAMAGFVTVDEGSLSVGGARITGPDPELGMVFQSSEALFDWMTVRQNVAFGPRMRGASRAEQTKLADEYLGLVGLRHCADRFPGQLSGGMRQRVQIAGCTVVFVTHDIDEAILLADRIAVMTAGPAASVKSVYPVDLPRPRDEDDPSAVELRRQLREDIGEEVRKALRDQGLDDASHDAEEDDR
jgi:NitT/TauT family transport system ATP-binding protein